MQRLSDQAHRERGAVAVVVALLMVPLIGFAALAIDVASMWSQQQRLQVAADASALAIAQDCAHNTSTCGSTSESTAESLTADNFGSGADTPLVTFPGSGEVTVGTRTTSNHQFAPILGIDSQKVGARATARWGAPTGATSVLPLTFSLACYFGAGGLPAATTETIIYPETPSTNVAGCSVPGGFGWVVSDSPSCGLSSTTATVNSAETILHSDTGSNVSNPCKAALIAARNKVVLLPIFNHTEGTGSNATYYVYGYAAFKLTGYYFPSASWQANVCRNSNCVIGYFLQVVDLNDAAAYASDVTYDPQAPNLGFQMIGLLG